MAFRLPSVLAGVGLTVAASLLLVSKPGQTDSKLPAAPTPAKPAAAPLVMASSNTCTGLRDLMVDTVVLQSIGYGYGYNPYGHGYYGHLKAGGVPRPTAARAAEDGAAAPTAAPAPAPATGTVTQTMPGPSHHTTTNVQERGVDEADIVKTDGRHVYTLHNNALVIAKTWPVAQTNVAARLTFKTLVPQQLYLRGNEVIIQGHATDHTGWNQGRTRVMVVDVSDRTAPRIKRTFDVEGYSTSSRLVGGELYLVQSNYVQPPRRLYELAQKTVAKIPRADQQTLRPWEVQSRLANTVRAAILHQLTQKDLDGALPRIRSGNTTKHMACGDLYIPANSMQLGMTTLAKLSVDDAKTDLIGAMVTGGQTYASTSALYVAAPQYTFNYQGYADYGTMIHKFSLGDKQTRPAYVASGKVEGSILNQFSMSEHDGNIRVATTDWNWTGQQGGNNLFVMRPFGRELRTIGSLRGLAKGERIYAGRMIGDKGYLVTFRQTDPLFTLDLRDPTRPRVVGELKINGFSSYIHPIGGDLLLTIGQDATDEGRVTGVHLQVFDVSDPARPRRKFHEKLSSKTYSSSAAQHDHHAFMYDPVTGTLAFPFQESGGSDWFTGLAVYKLDRKTGFHKKGKLDHHHLADVFFDEQCRQQKKQNPQNAHYICGNDYRRQARMSYPITRSMVVDKYILSLSPIGLEIHELGDLDMAATLSWANVEKKQAVIATQ